MVKMQGVEEFVSVHGLLLASAGVPSSLHERLFYKLSTDLFDAGSFFRIEPCEEDRQRRLLLSSSQGMRLHQDVFLVDHAWSFRLSQARTQLEQIPGLVERMATLMCVGEDAEEEGDQEFEEDAGGETEKADFEALVIAAKTAAQERGERLQWLELDDLGITDEDLQNLDLASRCPDLVILSLWGNKLESVDVVVNAVAGLSSLRALWLNNTPVALHQEDELKNEVAVVLPHLEIYNSKLTQEYGLWAIAVCAGICGADQPGLTPQAKNMLAGVTSLDLSNRNLQSLSPHVFNVEELPSLATLDLQGNPFTNESAATFLATLKALKSLQMLQTTQRKLKDTSLKVTVRRVQVGTLWRDCTLANIVEALPNLKKLNGLSVSKILEEGHEDVNGNLRPRLPVVSKDSSLVERVMGAMWQYILTYRLADDEKLDDSPVWYVMDELGSSLRHSDTPNFQVAPFMYLPDGTLESAISYSLLWPCQDIENGEECTRDYLFGIGEDQQRSSRLTAWFHSPPGVFKQAYKSHCDQLMQVVVKEPRADNAPSTKSICRQDGSPLTVFSDIPGVCDFLTRSEFKLVDEPKDANIIWTHMQIDDEFCKATGIKAHQYVNQFPSETCIVMKHNLADTMQKAFGSPSWLQPTYNMEGQLPALIGDFLEREEKNENNLWIVKPWNMARTIDTSIVGSLPALVRLVETGPKIGQKYIDQPALFHGRKFDLRYVVLLRSVQPLEIFICDVFWGRFSNNVYTTEPSSLSEYETHFTVMNYGGRTMNHLDTHKWVPEFEKEHNVNWQDIHARVRKMIRAVFEGAIAIYPDMHSPTSRAIYGVDVMLDASFQPKLLEVTYCPDCGRACKYDVNNILGDGELIQGSEFFNDVFSCLFLNETRHMSPL